MSIAMRPVRTLLDQLSDRNMRLHSLLVHRHGEVLLDLWQWPHEPDRRHKLHSGTKSFTVAAVGFAEAEGLLSLDDRLLDFFGDQVPEPGEHLRDMRVRDLLTMRTGHARGLSGATTRLRKTGWTGEFLEEPVVEPPGRNFLYSSTTSHVLSAIVQQVAGLPVDEYLRPRLFAPLGITDFSWERDPAGVCSGGNGLTLRPSDLLSFGVLHLNGGRWRGEQVLPEGWVQKASSLHVPRAISGHWNGKELVPPGPDEVAKTGYGYQFWVYRDGIYNASGIFGQECMVFPDHDAVVVVTGAMGNPDYYDIPHLLRDTFIRAFDEADGGADAEAEIAVAERVKRAREPEALRSDVQRPGFAASYAIEPGEHGLTGLAVAVRPDSVLVTVTDDTGTHPIEHGLGRWIEQDTGVSGWRLHHTYQDASAPIVAGAQWDGPDALELAWHYVEAPFIDRLRLEFTGSGVTVAHSTNVNSGATELPLARGTLT